MLLGFGGFVIANLLLITMPPGNYWLLLLSVLIDAVSVAMFDPLMQSLVIVSITKEERARINAILMVVVIVLTSPFGWIAGQLSEMNRILPFVLNIGLFLIGGILVLLAWRFAKQSEAIQPAT
jgi:predicted MFS family arabinose efflux permease